MNAGVRRNQKGHSVSNFHGLAPAASGTMLVMRSTASGLFQSCLAAPGGLDRARRQGVHADPVLAHSTASVCVIDMTPALAAAECTVPALPVQT